MKRYTIVTCALLVLVDIRVLAANPLNTGVTLQIRQGRQTVDGVYVNGHGPYRFLVDTGATLNQIDPKLAQSIGLTATFQTQLTSSTSVIGVSGSKGINVRLDSVSADGQAFLFVAMEALHQISPDIQGVLGQVFLSRFDYLLDLRIERLKFGERQFEEKGTRAPFKIVQGRPVVSTSLGPLVLDSGAHLMVRFGVEAAEMTHKIITATGSVRVGTVYSNLVIDGRTFWSGEAVAVPRSPETGAAGLLPISLFETVYVCNSEGYVVL